MSNSIEEVMECIRIQRILGNDELADKLEQDLTDYIEGDIAPCGTCCKG